MGRISRYELSPAFGGSTVDLFGTIGYMSSQPIRIDAKTLHGLREQSARTGEPLVRLAQRYIDAVSYTHLTLPTILRV